MFNSKCTTSFPRSAEMPKKGEMRGNCEAQGSSRAIYISDTAPRYLAANEMSIEAGNWPNQMLIEEETDGSPEVSVPALLLSILTAFFCVRVGEKKGLPLCFTHP